MTTTRDKIVHAVANWVINTFATEEYRERLEFTYVLGLAELDARHGDTSGHPFHEEIR